MAAALVKGQNAGIAAGEVVLSVRGGVAADLSALLVTAAGTVRSDADFVFFNQPVAPGVRLDGPGIAVTFAGVPAAIEQIRAVITVAAEGDTFGSGSSPVASVADRAGNSLYEYVIDGLDSESVVIALELYRRGDQWKVRAVGQGYAGGFADLVTDHGVSVDDEPETGAVPEIRTVPGEAALSFEKRQKLDLRKREVAKVLIDERAFGVRARVVLVIDKTGSMQKLYRGGTVHRVVERMIPIATQLDDDGTLEAYLYALTYARLPDITVAGADRWTQTYLHLTGTHDGIDYDAIGGRNDELPVMRAVIDTLTATTAPTLVLFFTDGGFAKKRDIATLMREASHLPAFWQFIGLGRANFGVLRTLDELDGRRVDNAGFFAVDDIDHTDDPTLYRHLLTEFPAWLRAARAEGIVSE
ncbi:stress protein [Nocardia asteroides NBRC 15531]|uniref:Tellurium resistance protein n=1 Tax=Nocardia asteroides NBRC 15531 TaxID=1110697 RepID=U5EB79_NOCAS|nr:VWA domain-containing protein [Nocardia asteroides]TLF63618.1 stress protein [Nocardia asteroides NBRC 15531]UGT46924.1 VWA domain-containing protein [Nocardia asteroides]SFM84610.1 Stress response protein SCP2 [Nocardia asteroides]VEG34214.1 General stress protein 16U [Nocardia asteroides]GAD87377.1 putative tellurium resistance protein [Nocardia asteroides NBRC 15531]